MAWPEDFMALAAWALQIQDLRHRLLFSNEPQEIARAAGIARCLESTVVLAIYEAATAKGYRTGVTVGYEVPYPGNVGGNPQRADLRFKDPGPGKNWGYIEVKAYKTLSTAHVRKDIDKLRSIAQRVQRWLFLYRVRTVGSKEPTLESLLKRNFGGELSNVGVGSFPTMDKFGECASCEFCLARVN
ncbi:MAG: hypothetical protein EOM24_25430 [Chloroflexia bacterium]|nr:hypothetical protein [Chloroflexia bacterium]